MSKAKRVIVLILSAITLLLFGLSMTTVRKVNAANEIDYVNQNYHDIPERGSFYYASIDIIYKIHCPDIRSAVNDTDKMSDYVNMISFRAATGYQIYFVNGVACDFEELSNGDYEYNGRFTKYYEILRYDETNNFVYVKFKNLDDLLNNIEDETLEDVSIGQRETNTYVQPVQYIYISEIQTPVTEITSDDVYFLSEVKAANGTEKLTNKNLYSVRYTIKLNQKVSHLVDKIDVSFVNGGEKFTLYQSSFIVSDGQGDDNGYIEFTVITLGDMSDITDNVKLQAKITYGEKNLTVESTETNLITLWQSLVKDGFDSYDYYKNVSNDNQTHIKKLVETYNTGFYEEIKGLQNNFADYDENTDVKLTSLIFKIPMENLSYASFDWSSEYYQGYTYYVSASIDDNLYLTTTAYKKESNDNGTVYDTSVSQKIYDSVDYFAYNGSLYVRIKDDTPVTSYFPQKATKSFSAYANDKSNNSVTLQSNTVTIIYDDYNKELLDQIEKLKQQLADMQKALNEKETKISALEAEITEKANKIETLENKKSDLEKQIEEAEKAHDIDTANITALSSELETVKSSLNSEKKELVEKIAELNVEVNTYKSKVTAYEKAEEERKEQESEEISVGCTANVGTAMPIICIIAVMLSCIILGGKIYAHKKR